LVRLFKEFWSKAISLTSGSWTLGLVGLIPWFFFPGYGGN